MTGSALVVKPVVKYISRCLTYGAVCGTRMPKPNIIFGTMNHTAYMQGRTPATRAYTSTVVWVPPIWTAIGDTLRTALMVLSISGN